MLLEVLLGELLLAKQRVVCLSFAELGSWPACDGTVGRFCHVTIITLLLLLLLLSLLLLLLLLLLLCNRILQGACAWVLSMPFTSSFVRTQNW